MNIKKIFSVFPQMQVLIEKKLPWENFFYFHPHLRENWNFSGFYKVGKVSQRATKNVKSF